MEKAGFGGAPDLRASRGRDGEISLEAHPAVLHSQGVPGQPVSKGGKGGEVKGSWGRKKGEREEEREGEAT